MKFTLRRQWSGLLVLCICITLFFPIMARAADVPRVITLNPTQYQQVVTLKGTIVDNGGKAVVDNGFYVGTDRNNLDRKMPTGKPYELLLETNALQPNTAYYVQAYAVNELGEGLGEVISFQTGASAANTQPQSENEKLAEEIRKLYGVQVSWDVGAEWNDYAKYTAAGEADNKRALQNIKLAFSKYSQRFFLRLRLRKIVIGKNVTDAKGAVIRGVSQGNTQQTMMLFDVKAPEQVIHHELFHCFEYASDVKFFEWKDANISGFRYDVNYDSGDASLLPPGFVTRYSTSMEEEDRADLFMYLMTESLRASLLDQAAHDAVLKAKTQILVKAMKRYFGSMVDGSRFVTVGDQVVLADKPRILGYAFVENSAGLYNGPSTKYYPRKDVRSGVALPVVARSSQWLKVLDADGKPYYVQDREIVFQTDAQRNEERLALGKQAANISRKTGVMVMYEGWKKPPSSITLSVSKDNKRIKGMLDELSAFLGDNAKSSVGSIKNIILCSDLSVKGIASPAAVNGNSLYLNMVMIKEGGLEAATRQILNTNT